MRPALARTVVARLTIAMALVSLAAAPAAHADPVTSPVETWVPDGEVKAVTVSGSTAYLGGNFTRIGPYTGSSALFDAADGSLKEPWPEVDGVVNAVVADGSGGWYLGGDFRSVGSTPRTDLAHVLADRTVDPAWAPTTDGTVRALAVAPGEVYAGGEFATANGQTRGHLAAFSRTTGAITTFTGGVSNSGFDDFKGVHALLLNGPTLYVGGIFDQAQGSNTTGATRHRVAAFNTANGQVLAWDPDANHTVNGLALVPNTTDVFISGRFNALKDNTASEVARHGIAKVDGTNGTADANWIAPLQFGPELTSMAVSGTTVYIGGSNINFGQGKLPAAALSVVGPVASATWKPATPGAVTSLAVAGTTVYIGTGDFGSGPLSNGPHPGLIAVDATNANPKPFAPQFGRGKQQFPSGGTVGTRAIGVNGSDVVAGGTFINVGGVERRNLAAIDLNTGQPTAFNPPLKGQFSALTAIDAVAVTDDGLVWAGGNFITEGPNERLNLAAFDASSGSLASFHRDPNSNGVSALMARGSTVLVGGSFSSLGGTPRHNAAAVRNVPGEDGTVLPFDVDTDGPVRAFALDGDTLYLGGQFQNVNRGLAALARERHNVAAVDADTGLAKPWDPDTHGQVHTLALAGDTIYAGGEFDTVNGSTPRQRLAAFDRQGGTARTWDPGADAPVRSLSVYGSTVFAGGDFASVNGGVPRRGLAALNAQTGASDPLSVELSPEERDGPLPPVARVDALFASPETGLLMGGGFVMNTPALRGANLARFGLTPPPQPEAPGGQTPGGPGGGQLTPGDGLAPGLSAFSASATRFRVGPGATAADGTATAAAAKKKKKPPRGTTLTLRLSEPARVKFEVLIKGKGRKVGKRCVKQTKRNRKRKRCTRLTLKKPTFTRSAPAGRSKVKWSGRLGRKALKRGSYQLRATPTDAAGNTGKARTLNFTIVR